MHLRSKNRFATFSFIILPLLLMVAGLFPGCGIQTTWISYKETSFKPEILTNGNVILGGVVLRHGATLDRLSGVDYSSEEFTSTVQANIWTPLFWEAFLSRTGKKVAVDWFHFSSCSPVETWEKMLDRHARQFVISPDLLATCHEAFPDIPYLLMARVEHTLLDSRLRGDYGAQNASGRLMTMSLDVYDLEKGLSVFTYSLEYYDNGPGNPGYDEVEDRIRIQLPDSTGGNVEVDGYIIKAPTVASVVRKCLYELLAPLYLGSLDCDLDLQ